VSESPLYGYVEQSQPKSTAVARNQFARGAPRWVDTGVFSIILIAALVVAATTARASNPEEKTADIAITGEIL
jgi:hypothetical protein